VENENLPYIGTAIEIRDEEVFYGTHYRGTVSNHIDIDAINVKLSGNCARISPPSI
jgi:hypothetical protein